MKIKGEEERGEREEGRKERKQEEMKLNYVWKRTANVRKSKAEKEKKRGNEKV